MWYISSVCTGVLPSQQQAVQGKADREAPSEHSVHSNHFPRVRAIAKGDVPTSDAAASRLRHHAMQLVTAANHVPTTTGTHSRGAPDVNVFDSLVWLASVVVGSMGVIPGVVAKESAQIRKPLRVTLQSTPSHQHK